MTIKPDLTGTYGGGDLSDFPISNLKADGDKATMDVTLKVGDGKVSGSLDYGQGAATIGDNR